MNDALKAQPNKSTTCTKTEVNYALIAKANQLTTYTKTEVDNVLNQSQYEESLNEPFKSRIYEFLKLAIEKCKEQEINHSRCKLKFFKIVQSYCMKPKGMKLMTIIN